MTWTPQPTAVTCNMLLAAMCSHVRNAALRRIEQLFIQKYTTLETPVADVRRTESTVNGDVHTAQGGQASLTPELTEIISRTFS